MTSLNAQHWYNLLDTGWNYTNTADQLVKATTIDVGLTPTYTHIMIHSGFGGLVTTPITRREILILICMTLMFTLLLQFNMGSVSSWKIGSSRASDDQGSVIRKEEPLSLNDEWTDEQEVRFGHVVAEDPFMGDLAGYNDLASHGTVGRWREMTMKNTLVRWQDQDIPRTKLINHAPGE